ncbi:MAG: nucleotidyl transferase AbiEii/AbiGii toxin family protein [Candidatus Thorarchaeota archaeon]
MIIIQQLITNAVEQASESSGISFEPSIRFRVVKTGYEGRVYFSIRPRSGYSLKIKIDITKAENESVLLPAERRRIIHPYPDDLTSDVLVYSFREIFAEKIRSLFERTRPRDLYDVWQLSQLHLKVIDILSTKFEAKQVVPNLNFLLGREESFSSAWEQSLTHQLTNLPNPHTVFDAVFSYLSNLL